MSEPNKGAMLDNVKVALAGVHAAWDNQIHRASYERTANWRRRRCLRCGRSRTGHDMRQRELRAQLGAA